MHWCCSCTLHNLPEHTVCILIRVNTTSYHLMEISAYLEVVLESSSNQVLIMHCVLYPVQCNCIPYSLLYPCNKILSCHFTALCYNVVLFVFSRPRLPMCRASCLIWSPVPPALSLRQYTTHSSYLYTFILPSLSWTVTCHYHAVSLLLALVLVELQVTLTKN